MHHPEDNNSYGVLFCVFCVVFGCAFITKKWVGFAFGVWHGGLLVACTVRDGRLCWRGMLFLCIMQIFRI